MLDSTTNTNYLVTGLTAGTIYEFKLEALNQYDYSVYSSTLPLLCAYIPEVPTTVLTEIEGATVKISWVLPSENGSPITEYKVYLREKVS